MEFILFLGQRIGINAFHRIFYANVNKPGIWSPSFLYSGKKTPKKYRVYLIILVFNYLFLTKNTINIFIIFESFLLYGTYDVKYIISDVGSRIIFSFSIMTQKVFHRVIEVKHNATFTSGSNRGCYFSLM